MDAELRSMLEEILKRLDGIERFATVDPLTGLHTRAFFDDALGTSIATAQRHDRRVAVIFIDLDGFKLVNDTLGHKIGDAVLQEVAQRLRDSLRTGDLPSRRGGDEFVVLIDDVLDLATIAQKLITVLGTPYLIAAGKAVTASLGIATYPVDGGDAATLVHAADEAMLRAKARGRNCYEFYSTRTNEQGLITPGG